MQSDGNLDSGDPQQYRRYYDEAMQAIRADFEANPHRIQSGAVAIRARASAVDQLVRNLWTDATPGVALVAVGGYGRRELFPFSDVDLMFLLNPRVPERTVKNSIRMLNQALWDCGVRVSPMTRTLAECTRFDPENVEFTLSLLDSRFVAGDQSLTSALVGKAIPKLLAHERKRCIARLLQVTETRHAKFGDTLFHLEPNVKETPGGLRDVHVCAWLDRLTEATLSVSGESEEFLEAREFLLLVRAFLHFRHNRDDNTLDWRTQDEAAANRLGAPHGSDDPAFWMRLYFRHARAIERRITQATEELTAPARGLLSALSGIRRTRRRTANSGYENTGNRILFSEIGGKDAGPDPANDPEVAFAIFAEIARTGARLPCSTELRLEGALPVLSAQIEDGPGLWLQLQSILTGPFAGRALRAMHAIGILELVIPEFHGIDALVIRDAYHRYTVDEHTFVLIDTLHALSTESAIRDPWATRFAALLRDLPHPALLFLAALLHDTGKGHLSDAHATESERMARNLLDRLEVDPYEAALVLDIIRNHLEMSAALRRDVFDQETVRSFAARVPTPEALRMLTLFTYADITAVHPDALTPWKAENLWRLYMATSNFLDRNVDDERVASMAATEQTEVLHRVHALLPRREAEVGAFLEGLPRRYLLTRTPEQIRAHVELATGLSTVDPERIQLDFRYAPGLSELTLITRDRPRLFAALAGALAAWQMNVVTADAFSNAHGLVVDSCRFTDTFRTLELNESERSRFVDSIRDLVSGKANLEPMLAARRRARRPAPKVVVETRIDFDDSASSHSTLLQVIAQDTPGLLRAISLTLAEHRCNIEVALVDTEGEMAIDVFYVTRVGNKLGQAEQIALHTSLLQAIEANVR